MHGFPLQDANVTSRLWVDFNSLHRDGTIGATTRFASDSVEEGEIVLLHDDEGLFADAAVTRIASGYGEYDVVHCRLIGAVRDHADLEPP